LIVRSGYPPRVWNIAKQERDKDEGRAAAALAEATAAKLVSITAALRVYDEELAASARRQVAEAEKLARVAERRLAEVSPMMETAAQLVRELRAALDALRPASAPGGGAPPEPDPDARATVEMPRLPATGAPPPEDAEEDPEELTTVAARPVDTLAARNGLRLTPRAGAALPDADAGPRSARQGKR
jgi:hypothetical protein